VRRLILLLIRAYQWTLSPFLGPACRFYPSCSEYTYQAVESHGFFTGVRMGILRILRCNPFCPGGYDPVPRGHDPICSWDTIPIHKPESGRVPQIGIVSRDNCPQRGEA
jgi:uncharacterized protein